MGMDVQGVQSLKANKRVEGLFVYVAPPSLQELEVRQRGRYAWDLAPCTWHRTLRMLKIDQKLPSLTQQTCDLTHASC